MHVSVILPAHNEGQNLVDTVGYVLQNSGDVDLEVIIVDDGSDDGSPAAALARYGTAPLRVARGAGLGIARARNLGAAQARGQALVFLDAHCYLPPGWLAPLADALAGADVGMVGPVFAGIREITTRACGIAWQDASLENVWLPPPAAVAEVPFHIGACQAMPAAVFREVGGYDAGMTRWGSEDIELCLRLWLYGYRVLAQPDSLVFHLFRPRHPYAVDVSQALYNKLRLALSHFDEARLALALRSLMAYPDFSRSLARAFLDDTLSHRACLFARRQRDMDWFCAYFGIKI
ncbi:MAG: hypothetical protein Fur0021_31510 [Candidatus Promineifilaceae bacterium]